MLLNVDRRIMRTGGNGSLIEPSSHVSYSLALSDGMFILIHVVHLYTYEMGLWCQFHLSVSEAY